MKQFASVKTMALVLIAAMLALFVLACEGEPGPTGPQGTAGAQGPAGPAGSQTGTSIMLDRFQYRAATDKDNNVEFAIYGAGFLPNERVELVLLMPSRNTNTLLAADADKGGAFLHKVSPFFTLVAEPAGGAEGGLGHYVIIATGLESGNMASASFVLIQ